MIRFRPVRNIFSRYADKTEKELNNLISKTTFWDYGRVKVELKRLMQENLVVVSLWLEKDFKGYRVLKKWKRASLYRNAEKILEKFEEFATKNLINTEILDQMIEKLGVRVKGEELEKVKFMALVMSFLKPGERYVYEEGASFRRLLVDIQNEKLIGDCNQIVTLYCFLYSTRFDLSDLKLKILPEHVCLNMFGVDIEATNASFQKYADGKILEIEELPSVNLLDVSDFRDKQNRVNARDVLRGAKLAERISSQRGVVEHNLIVAYKRLALESIENGDIDGAKTLAEMSRDREFLLEVMKNGAIALAKNGKFGRAIYFAKNASDFELAKKIRGMEGRSLFRSKKFEKAAEVFREVGDIEMEKACYREIYNGLVEQVKHVKTMGEARFKKEVYKKMKEMARKAGESRLESEIDEILKQLN